MLRLIALLLHACSIGWYIFGEMQHAIVMYLWAITMSIWAKEN